MLCCILDMLLYFRRLWLSCLAYISAGIPTSTIFVPICADLLATAKYATGIFLGGGGVNVLEILHTHAQYDHSWCPYQTKCIPSKCLLLELHSVRRFNMPVLWSMWVSYNKSLQGPA